MKTKLLFLFAFLTIAFSKSNAQQVVLTANYPFGNCPPAQVDVTVSPAIGASYQWYFSDGTSYTSASATESHTFTSAGYNYASVSILDANGNYITNVYVNINLAGVQSIYMNPYNKKVCPGDPISIYVPYYNYGSGSSNNATFTWDYGDGSPVQTGSNNGSDHTYAVAGDYTVTCTAQFSGCPSSVLTDTVHVQNNLPILTSAGGTNPGGGLYFNLYPDSVCIGDAVQANFDNNLYKRYFIDFGDGYTSNSNLFHGYAFNGKYYGSLTVTNGCGNSATVYDSVIVASGLAVNNSPYFYPNNYQNCPNTPITLYGPVGYSHYNWSFSNNTGSSTSTLNSPNVSYANPGVYPVTLTVQNGCGNSNSRTDSVHIVNNLPVGSVSLNMADTICPGTPVIISVYANGANNYNVNYTPTQSLYTPNGGLGSDGNGGSGSSANGVITYQSPGTYTVTATATNGCGNSSTSTQTVEVYLGAPLDVSSFMFGAPDKESCAGDTTFVAIAPANIGTFQVDFGDGSPIVTTPQFTVSANGGINYAIFKHKYPGVGNYVASGTVTNACGNSATQSSAVNATSGAALKDAGILFDNTKYLCMQDEVKFTGFGASKYTFDFGDQTPLVTSNQSFPTVSHKYPYAGLFKLRVLMENSCGARDTFKQDINIQYSYIGITTNSVNSAGCGQQKGKAIASVNYGANPPYTFSWTNGDHSAIADTLTAGIYEVTVTDSKGCSSRAISTVSDATAPTIAISNNIQVTCFGGTDGALGINVIGGSAPYTFSWSNGATTQNINNLVVGPYEVTVKDANHCVSTKSFTVTTNSSDFNASFQIHNAACGTADGSITAVMSPNWSYNYVWSNGISTAANTYIAAGVYHLTVIDYNGCIKDYDVTLNNTGAPNVALDSISSVNCLGNGNEIYVSTYPTPAQPGPFTYSWSPSAATSEDLIGVSSGSYTLTVTGAGNCKSFETVNIGDAAMLENPICLVTVDTTTATNKVVWEQVTQPNVASFNIYRESSQAGLYYLIGNVSKDSLHEFIDPAADPSIRGWRYKLTALSTCGVESDRSAEHKTIHLTINKGLGNAYNLIWDDYIGQTVPTFFIWRYTNVSGWVKIDSIPSNLFSYTDLTAPSVASAASLSYMVEGGPLTACDPTRAAINTSRSNIKNARGAAPGATGIAQKSASQNISIYPNPNEGVFTVNVGRTLDKKTDLYIVNTLGEIVYTEQFNQNASSKTVDVSSLQNGIYFVKMLVNESLVVKRIVVSK